MGMGTYIAKRVVHSIGIIFVILFLNFIIINSAPGNPALFMGGEVALSSPEYVKALMHRWGLDKPLYERTLIYFEHLLKGDLGYSYRYMEPVSSLILERLPVTLLLTLSSSLLAFVIGVWLGLASARRVKSKTDAAITTTMFVFWSTPSFWLGIMLMILFGVRLRLFPVSGMVSVSHLGGGVWYYLDILYHAVLPVTTLTLIMTPLYYKLTRDTAIQQLREDYVTTFRAVGLGEGYLFRKYVFRNSILPPITAFGLQLGYAVAGAVLVENVFGWPGMGRLLLDSILMRDYPVIMGIYVFVSVTVILSILLVDILYALLDPRIKYG